MLDGEKGDRKILLFTSYPGYKGSTLMHRVRYLRFAMATIALPITIHSIAPAAEEHSTVGVVFVDATATAGIDFVHENGASGRKYFPETMGAGAAFFDSDGDGDLDVYLVNGAPLPGYEGANKPLNALYRNDGAGRFANFSTPSGTAADSYGMGCAAADYDNDGDRDLFLTNFGPNALYQNTGDGRFVEVSHRAGVYDAHWSAGSAFFDSDNDGDLDLYVANYVHYDLARVSESFEPYLLAATRSGSKSDKTYPHPRNFPGAADVLYRNEGDGIFEDVSGIAGLADTVETEGRGLGVVAGDFDDDGDQDLYVANDAVRNFFYRNKGDGTFAEVGALAGVTYGQDGQKEAGMGVDAGDYNNDGRIDLVVTNFEQEPAGLYENRRDGFFVHVAFASGLGLISLKPLGFGSGFLDYDNDGFLDLFIANGHVLDNIALFDRSTTYAQRNLLLRNQGPNAGGRFRFKDATPQTGIAKLSAQVSRGSAFGDYDDDGDVDILVANCAQAARLLRNDGGHKANNWLAIRAVGTRSNRDAIGTRITVRAGDLSQVKEIKGSYSYLSQSDLRAHFGMESHTEVDRVEIRWPSGGTEHWSQLEVNQFLTLVEGEGIAEQIHGQSGDL